MATSFPLNPQVNDLYQGYYWNGSFWKKSGQDAGFGYLEEAALQNTYLSQSSASTIYATQTDLDNIDLSLYLTQSSASTTYATKTALNNIDLSTYLTSASMQTVPVYVMNSGSSAQRPVSASAGMIRFNTTLGYPEWYDPSTSAWFNFYQEKSFSAEYLIVAGGGGGATDADVGGGGGGGGLLTGSLTFTKQLYTVTVGAGGLKGTGPDSTGTGGGSNGGNGANSVFSNLTAIGGGGGGTRGNSGLTGGSGGGGGDNGGGAGAGTAGQGFAGGAAPGINTNGGRDSGGGGGAGGTATAPNVAGIGLYNAIGGATFAKGGIGSQAGLGLVAGADNTGNGGDGCRAGGSGVVVLRYPSGVTLSIGAGLTHSTSIVGLNKVTTFTAGTGSITI